MTLPRVLLVEDDVSIRRFIAMALDELPIELEASASLAEARSALCRGPYCLMLTDLTLPDGSGLELLAELRTRSDAPARVAVFSGGVTAVVRQRLAELEVDVVLPKPVPLVALEACVRDAIGAANLPSVSPHADDSAEQTVIDTYFGGDATLFFTYRDSCMSQFERDVAAGDAAVAGADTQSLRRITHSLKTVLRMLGQDELAEGAARAEELAAQADPRAALSWSTLRGHLTGLASSRRKVIRETRPAR